MQKQKTSFKKLAKKLTTPPADETAMSTAERKRWLKGLRAEWKIQSPDWMKKTLSSH